MNFQLVLQIVINRRMIRMFAFDTSTEQICRLQKFASATPQTHSIGVAAKKIRRSPLKLSSSLNYDDRTLIK